MIANTRHEIAAGPLPNQIAEKSSFAQQMMGRLGDRIHMPYGHVSLARRGKLPKGSTAPIY